MKTAGIIATTGNEVTGHEIYECLGVLGDTVVRAPTISQGIAAA
ncbi:MAG: hypothetical protein VXZ82_12580 [Planctomycetota bacterium]|nr:hypothetical protein [Planctomycetota bacterium]